MVLVCVNQPLVFHPLINSVFHSSFKKFTIEASQPRGIGPNELPLRYVIPSGMWNIARVLLKSVMGLSFGLGHPPACCVEQVLQSCLGIINSQ